MFICNNLSLRPASMNEKTLKRCDSERNFIQFIFETRDLYEMGSHYFIAKEWFNRWKEYVGYDDFSKQYANESFHPGPINNQSILNETVRTKYKPDIRMNKDAVIVPFTAWAVLLDAYGLISTQIPLICQNKIPWLEYKACSDKNENNKMLISIMMRNTINNIHYLEYDKKDSFEKLEKDAKELLKIADHVEIEFLYKKKDNNVVSLTNKKINFEEAGIEQYQLILIQEIDETEMILTHEKDTQDAEFVPGLCGLTNLGNTCFMNATLQCLSNIPLLAEFFLEERNLVNISNPLIRAFADLIKVLWSGHHSSHKPDEFKRIVDEFAPQFSDGQQHDCEEFLTKFLGEFAELTYSSEERLDRKMANEICKTGVNNADSIMNDTFKVLVTSTICCTSPGCDERSATIEPSNMLMLSMPTENERSYVCVFFPFNATIVPIQIHVVMSEQDFVIDLCDEVAAVLKLEDVCRMIAVKAGDKINVFLDDDYPLSNLEKDEIIYLYEQPPKEIKIRGSTTLFVYFEELIDETKARTIGLPFLIQIPRNMTSDDSLYKNILHRFKRFIHSPNPPKNEIGNNGGSCENTTYKKPITYKFVPTQIGKQSLIILWEQNEKINFFDEQEARKVDTYESMENKTIQKIDLRDCLEHYFQDETLETPWSCPRCPEQTKAIKKLSLDSEPNVLIIELKRYTQSTKMDIFVNYPLEGLDLSEYFANPDHKCSGYDMIAVANHEGLTRIEGHYTTIAKHKLNGQWYLFDDETVTQHSPQEVKSSDAYLLFYIKRK